MKKIKYNLVLRDISCNEIGYEYTYKKYKSPFLALRMRDHMQNIIDTYDYINITEEKADFNCVCIEVEYDED